MKKQLQILLAVQIIIGSLVFLASCSSSQSIPEDMVPFAGRYSVVRNGKPAGTVSVKTAWAEKDGQRVVRSRFVYTSQKKFYFESGSFLTTVVSYSNYSLFDETSAGQAVYGLQRELSLLTNTYRYLKLMRRRLAYNFVRYHGAMAKGKERYVEEKLRVTRKSVTASLPNSLLEWKFSGKECLSYGKIKQGVISNRMKFSETPTMLHGFRNEIYRVVRQGKKKGRLSFFLPGLFLASHDVTFSVAKVTNAASFQVAFVDAAGQKSRIMLDKSFVPLSVHFGTNLQLKRILPKKIKRARKKR